ncbi:MAG: DinB family protein [Caldilineales bacterium]|nr:DinB family protein [Caldilineales bacterium]
MPTTAERQERISRIRRLPGQIETLTAGLSSAQLSTHFLAGEWTVAQNVHHLADSHMNSYIRCKLIAAEDTPLLKPYDQDVWADMADAKSAYLAPSFALLAGLHIRWVEFWEGLADEDWGRTGIHPENGEVSLDDILALYADHGEAHIDQITRTLAAQ